MVSARVLLLAAAVASLAACSTLRTSADYDRSTDFSRYRTFALKDVKVKDDILSRRVEKTLETQLEARGLSESDAPDLWIVPRVRLDHETQIDTFGSGGGWRWHAWPGWSVSTVEKIPVGTLVVDVVDARRDELVWRGTATDRLSPDATPAERDKAMDEAVAKLFRSFPPA